MESYPASEESRSESIGPDSGPAASSNSNPLSVPLILGTCNSGNGGASARQSPKVCVTPASQLMLQGNSSTLSPSVARKIMSKNSNNTIFLTSYPNNQAELQLFRVMQNASLLLYYDTLLEMGGDDVQQLCDAGEEEFLEIMSLVGMASKPLHVRRFQKSLQEWVNNPTKFKVPLVPGEDFELELCSPRITSNQAFYAENSDSNSHRPIYSPSSSDICALPPVSSPGLPLNNKRPYSPLDSVCPASSSSSPLGNVTSQMSPCLIDSQIAKLAASAERLSKQLPQFEPKPHNTKKKVCKDLELVMSMSENDPRRMDEIRKYAAIYGRFDCKRKPEKPLTLHEVSVNEAAAQICRFIPALLTRRDELFPLARQVVKDSGCYYSKTQLSSVYINKQVNMGHDRESDHFSSRTSPRLGSEHDGSSIKRPKVETNSDGDDLRQDYDDAAVMRISLHSLLPQNTKNQHTSERGNYSRRSSIGTENEESDSQYGYNSNSPQRKIGDRSDTEDDASKFSPKVQVVAASGDNIIAVANPALVMSQAINPTLTTVIEKRSARTEID